MYKVIIKFQYLLMIVFWELIGFLQNLSYLSKIQGLSVKIYNISIIPTSRALQRIMQQNSPVEQPKTTQQQSCTTSVISAKQPIKKPRHLITGIPQHYYQNPNLQHAISILPSHYNFQIYKTLYRIQLSSEQLSTKQISVSLQFPQGLMLYACIIADILKVFSYQINQINLSTIIMGDVTYGACCVDDIASDLMDCHLLIHYGHSCLVPITQTRRKILYIFVQIQIDIEHFIETCIFNFSGLKKQTFFLMSTIQFNNSLYITKQKLVENGFESIVIPQQKPRSGGQVLGCTSPTLPLQQQGRNIVIFLCDGRFHMEASMIANPKFQFYQYDPYTRIITEQRYATDLMIQRRSQQIQKAQAGNNKNLCFILGTLGRQGNPQILNRLIKKIEGRFQYMILLASQVNTQLLSILPVDFYVQIACPRLSIDWAYGTPKPLLTPYELYVLIDKINIKQHYSMDYYSSNGGPWSNFYGRTVPKAVKKVIKTKPKVQLKMEDIEEKNLQTEKIEN